MDDAGSGMQASPPTSTTDIDKLHELGYAQELKRGMGAFSNFAVSFTIISILSGCLTLFGYGMVVGGPASAAYGWPLVGLWSPSSRSRWPRSAPAIPTAGGLYYWSAKIAPKSGPAWSWFTGWFNFLGQVAVTAGIDFGFAAFFCAFLNIAFNVEVTELILRGLLHGGPRRARPDEHVRGPAGGAPERRERLVARRRRADHLRDLFLVPDQHTSFGTIYSFKAAAAALRVFPAGFINGTGFSTGFFGSTLYIFLIGMLLAQYTLTGYDASAHMTEETHAAEVSGPNGHLEVGRGVGDLRLHPADRRLVRRPGRRPDTTTPLAGFQRGDGQRGGAGADLPGRGRARAGPIFMLLIVLGAQFFCGMSSVTANSRMIYAFSRDGAVPGHRSAWHKINKRTRTPTNSIWLARGVLAWLLVAPAYWRAASSRTSR